MIGDVTNLDYRIATSVLSMRRLAGAGTTIPGVPDTAPGAAAGLAGHELVKDKEVADLEVSVVLPDLEGLRSVYYGVEELRPGF